MKFRIAVLVLALSSVCWGTDAKNCKKPVPPTPPPPVTTSTGNTNTNTTASTSSSSSTATSSSTANSNQSQSQQQGQTQTATGGNATGGSASATGGGNGSNNNTSETKVAASAIAPPVLPTVPCFKGAGGAVQAGMIGGSFGGGKVDQGCDDRELARSFSGPQTVASCKILIATKKAKKAGITLEDCLGIVPTPIVAPQPVVVPEPVAPVIVVVQPPLVLPAKAVVLPRKRAIRHLPPNCQNVLQMVCKGEK